MKVITISELRKYLSRYVREVRRGGELQVLHRGTPVARLVPVGEDNRHGVRERLIRQGLLKPGKGNAAAILDEPPLVLPTNILDALAEDRND